MIWVDIVLAAMFAALITILGFTIMGNMKLQKEIEFLRIDCDRAERDLAITREECRNAQQQLAYRDGLRAGRRTDTLYQQLLKKFSDKEQFTVMMNGVKEGDKE